MYILDIKCKLKQQRMHLVSTRNFLIKQLELKREIISLVRDSEEKLNYALQQANPLSDTINLLREKLADDQRLYADCKVLIHEFRADIKTTKNGIERSKLKLHHLFSPQKTCGFFKQKDDNSQALNFSLQGTQTTLQDKLFKGA